jgi:hypothetical protein
MCECLSKTEKLLKDKTGDPKTYISYVYMVSLNKRIPAIEAIYREKKKDGSFCRKKTSMNIIYSYCPFCGEKVDIKQKK